MFQDKNLGRVGLLAGLGASAAILLSGCGGATNNASPAPAATPTIYGINPTTGETGSGLQSSDAKAGYLTGALSSTAKPLEGAVPLGFPAGGFFPNGTTASSAVTTGQASVVFRALIANGNAGNGISAIVPSSVVLTSPEVTGFTQPLTFDSSGVANGPNDGQYASAPFTLPFTTSGIHQLTAAVSDASGQSTSTTFGVVVVAPANVALFLQSFTIAVAATATAAATTTTMAITPGDTVTIDGGPGTGVYPTGYAATTADAQGTVVLFTTPGTHTVTETKGTTVVQTATFTIDPTLAGTTLIGVPVNVPTSTGTGGTGSTGTGGTGTGATGSVRAHLLRRH